MSPWSYGSYLQAAGDISITSRCSYRDIRCTWVWQAVSCLLDHSTCRQTGKHGGSCRGWMQMRFFLLIFLWHWHCWVEKKVIFLWKVLMYVGIILGSVFPTHEWYWATIRRRKKMKHFKTAWLGLSEYYKICQPVLYYCSFFSYVKNYFKKSPRKHMWRCFSSYYCLSNGAPTCICTTGY